MSLTSTQRKRFRKAETQNVQYFIVIAVRSLENRKRRHLKIKNMAF